MSDETTSRRWARFGIFPHPDIKCSFYAPALIFVLYFSFDMFEWALYSLCKVLYIKKFKDMTVRLDLIWYCRKGDVENTILGLREIRAFHLYERVACKIYWHVSHHSSAERVRAAGGMDEQKPFVFIRNILIPQIYIWTVSQSLSLCTIPLRFLW